MDGHYPIPKTARNAKTRSTAPRPHERRATGATVYYRLATWCPRSFVYKDNPHPHATAEEAVATVTKPGCYKLTRVDVAAGTVTEERLFNVADRACPRCGDLAPARVRDATIVCGACGEAYTPRR